ncbi:MAG: hypothetical protein HYW86_04025 [Candidatus Roizmanbacteria bacterium]|nr:MAG: hypothetical protein HYW86_04025 [Candidatus Roizmanbacteria bacterium]
MKKLQTGVIGSMGDSKLEQSLIETASELGKEIAKNKATLLFGFEGDFNSLSQIAARSAQDNGGDTVAFLWGNKQIDLGKLKSTRIVSGQNRGGGREFSFILSCDALICIGGGSGTLMEIAMAYQANIPIVVLKNTGGWSEKLANHFLDTRQRLKIIEANNAKHAMEIVIKLLSKS